MNTSNEVEEIECNDYRRDGCTADDGEPCPKCLARQGVDVFETALWNATAPRLGPLGSDPENQAQEGHPDMEPSPDLPEVGSPGV
jgi:hypothetical protein